MPEKLEEKTEIGRFIYDLKNVLDIKIAELAKFINISEGMFSKKSSMHYPEKNFLDKQLSKILLYLNVSEEIFASDTAKNMFINLFNNSKNITVTTFVKQFDTDFFPRNFSEEFINIDNKIILNIMCDESNVSTSKIKFINTVELIKDNIDKYPVELSLRLQCIFLIRALTIFSEKIRLGVSDNKPVLKNKSTSSKQINLLDIIDALNKDRTVINVKKKREIINEELAIYNELLLKSYCYILKSENKKLISFSYCVMSILKVYSVVNFDNQLFLLHASFILEKNKLDDMLKLFS